MGEVSGAGRASSLDLYRGCLLGGAVGDALGAAVEFHSLAEIHRRFGSAGIRDFAPAFGRIGAITDDTQMTLFTAEGLLRAIERGRERGIVDPVALVHEAYLRWLRTQRTVTPTAEDRRIGWLASESALYSRRAPGNTCLSALESGKVGSVDRPLNDSKGCGGIMRVAPVALARFWNPFDLGCDVAAITHGHPSGWLPAGFLAHVIRSVLDGATPREAIASARARLVERESHAETLAAVIAALREAARGSPSAERVESLGGGWTGEEALAIAIYCWLVCEDFESGVRLAVNHGGDSDSTGSIVGNLLGAQLGIQAIPARWLDQLELRDLVDTLATDLWHQASA